MTEPKKVSLFELETLEPVTIASNKGRGKFIETLRYIPASTILGAVSRQVLLDNISNNLGECSRISNPNVTPKCESCGVNECRYRILWKKREVKLTNAAFGNWNIQAPSIVDLQSLGELRSGPNGLKRDLLLYLFVEREGEEGKLPLNALLKRSLDSLNYKKKAGNVVGADMAGENGVGDVEVVQFGRVGVSYEFKASKKGELYGFTAIKEGQRFRFAAVINGELEDYFECETKVGAWRSRGMGLVKIKKVYTWDIEKYVEERRRQILHGFDKIGDLLAEYGVNNSYGTYTFLTDGTHENFGFDMSYKLHRIRRFRRYERKDDADFFILRDVISAGSTGVLSLNNPEKESQKLAQLEVKFMEEPWFNWIHFNHPIHYEKSLLREVIP